MVRMIMGQDDRVDVFQGQVCLEPPQNAGAAIEQYVFSAGLQQIARSRLSGIRVRSPPADDGQFDGVLLFTRVERFKFSADA